MELLIVGVVIGLFVLVGFTANTGSSNKQTNTKNDNIENENNISNNKELDSNSIIDSKINLQTCTKEELITLDGFTEDKANKFINERNNGKMWYDIDSFVQDFELQPHEMVLIQDRIKFPDKPKSKYGRKIDV